MRISIAQPRRRHRRNEKARRHLDAAQDCRFGGAPRPWGDCGVRCGIDRARAMSQGSRRCLARSRFSILRTAIAGQYNSPARPREWTGSSPHRLPSTARRLHQRFQEFLRSWTCARVWTRPLRSKRSRPARGIHRIVTPSWQTRADNRDINDDFCVRRLRGCNSCLFCVL